jgi:hypothetical protein
MCPWLLLRQNTHAARHGDASQGFGQRLTEAVRMRCQPFQPRLRGIHLIRDRSSPLTAVIVALSYVALEAGPSGTTG